MKIAVTGSLGLIGSSLIRALKHISDTDIIELDIRYNQDNSCYLDITDKIELKQKIKDCDGIIHLAAISRVVWGEQNPSLCKKINIDGTKNIIEACSSSKKKPWLIFASSREIYGSQDIFPVKESHTPNPINTYAKTKLAGERLIEEAYHTGLKAVILRFANVYGGVFDHNDRVVPSLCLNALKNQDLILKGKDVIIDFIFIDDVIEAILKTTFTLCNEKLDFLPILNISTSEPTSLVKLAKVIIGSTGSLSNIISLPKNTFAVDNFYGDNNLAYSILQWQPKFYLKDGIKRFIHSLHNKFEKHININFIHTRLNEDEGFKSYSWLPAEI